MDGKEGSMMDQAIADLLEIEQVEEVKEEQEQLPPDEEEVEVDEPEESAEADAEGDSEEELDFGDMPNGKIRYEKLKAKLAKQEAANNERIAKLEGMVELLTKQKPDDSEEVEYLSEEEQREKERDERAEAMQAEIDALKKDKIMEELRKKDDVFFENNPDLAKNRVAYSKKMLEFIRSKPGMAKDVYDGTTSLQEVHYMMGGKNSSVVQDPKQIFGTIKQSPKPGRTVPKEKDDVADAYAILKNPDSTNKAKAIDVIESSLVDILLHNK